LQWRKVKGSSFFSWAYCLIKNSLRNQARANQADKRRKETIPLDECPERLLGLAPDDGAEEKRQAVLSYWRAYARKHFKTKRQLAVIAALMSALEISPPGVKVTLEYIGRKAGVTREAVRLVIDKMGEITREAYGAT